MREPHESKPENLLERSLLESAGDESMRAEFYRRLLASEVHVLPVGGMPEISAGAIKAGSDVRLQTIGKSGEERVAFYSSPERLRQAGSESGEFLTMPAAAFFKLTKGSGLVMNPGVPFSRTFQPQEIEALLDGSIFGRVERIQAHHDAEISIGPPAEFPQDLADAISRLFGRYRTVKKAYLAEYLDPERDSNPGIIIGVDLDAPGDWNSVLKDSSVVIASVRHKHKFVDFIRFEAERGGIASYLETNVRPFYERG